jgi:hypothetical protein
MKHRLLKIVLWALIGAGIGALQVLRDSTSESWLGPTLVYSAAFALIGAVYSLLVRIGCKT